jgi:hypothetical protein
LSLSGDNPNVPDFIGKNGRHMSTRAKLGSRYL